MKATSQGMTSACRPSMVAEKPLSNGIVKTRIPASFASIWAIKPSAVVSKPSQAFCFRRATLSCQSGMSLTSSVCMRG